MGVLVAACAPCLAPEAPTGRGRTEPVAEPAAIRCVAAEPEAATGLGCVGAGACAKTHVTNTAAGIAASKTGRARKVLAFGM